MTRTYVPMIMVLPILYQYHPNPLVFVYFALAAATITASDGTHVHLPRRRAGNLFGKPKNIYYEGS